MHKQALNDGIVCDRKETSSDEEILCTNFVQGLIEKIDDIYTLLGF